jgi:hypothetical protein
LPGLAAQAARQSDSAETQFAAQPPALATFPAQPPALVPQAAAQFDSAQPTFPAQPPSQPPAPQFSGAQPVGPAQPLVLSWDFDGGAATWFVVQLAGLAVTMFTLGICYPWAVVMVYRWKAKHTTINGQRLRFTGSAPGLLGKWIVWLLLCLITFGIYSFWVYPRMTQWIVEHQEVDPSRPL